MVLAQQEEALARFGVNQSTTPAAFAAAEAQALAALNAAIADVTSAYGVITPISPTAAPVVAGAAGTGGGSAAATGTTGIGGAVGPPRRAWPPHADRWDGWCRTSGTGTSGTGTSGTGTAGTGTAGTGTAANQGGAGPTSGPFAGFVQDPTTGNLIDPATGRQADAGGRFLDPITGQPFGPASPFVSRLEGLDGGVSPVGGLLGGTAGPGVSVGALAPGLQGPRLASVRAVSAWWPGEPCPPRRRWRRGRVRREPRSYRIRVDRRVVRRRGAAEPVGAQPGGRAAAPAGGGEPQHDGGHGPAILRHRVGTGAGRLPPPMAGAGAGAGGGGAGRPPGRSMPRTGEPASVWGAAPGAGGRPDRRRPSSRSTAEVEDDEVWNGGTTVPSPSTAAEPPALCGSDERHARRTGSGDCAVRPTGSGAVGSGGNRSPAEQQGALGVGQHGGDRHRMLPVQDPELGGTDPVQRAGVLPPEQPGQRRPVAAPGDQHGVHRGPERSARRHRLRHVDGRAGPSRGRRVRGSREIADEQVRGPVGAGRGPPGTAAPDRAPGTGGLEQVPPAAGVVGRHRQQAADAQQPVGEQCRDAPVADHPDPARPGPIAGSSAGVEAASIPRNTPAGGTSSTTDTSRGSCHRTVGRAVIAGPARRRG